VAVSSGFAFISRHFSAGLLAVNQGKVTPKCRQRRRKCGAAILETRPKLNLKVNLCGADFSFCLSGAEGGDAAHR
ncbi:MAG: hypothetical protein IKF98_03045, partial [Clostridia bacterium]|nr:hypothetical protein [Clostridia bacterium]